MSDETAVQKAGGRVVYGRRLVCGVEGFVEPTDALIRSRATAAWWNFADSSWPCSPCGGRHCSECQYATDGETITVYDCGRFDD